MAITGHVVSDYPELRYSIYPLREISLDNWVFGYLASEYPRMEDGSLIPINTQDLQDFLNRGYRPFNDFESVLPVDVLKQHQELITELSKKSTPKSVEVSDIFRHEFNTSFVRLQDVLNESAFDCDNPLSTETDNVPALEFRVSNRLPALGKLLYVNNFFNIYDENNVKYIELVIDDGSDQRIYKISTASKFILDINTPYGKIKVRRKYVSTTTTLTEGSTMKSLVRGIANSLAKTDFSSGTSGQDVLEDAITRSSVSFNLSGMGIDFDDLITLGNAFGNNMYGILIYKAGVTPTKTLNKDTGTITIADFSKCINYGYVDMKDFNYSGTLATLQGYRTKLSIQNTSMNYVKFPSILTNSEFLSTDTTAGYVDNWTATGGGANNGIYDVNAGGLPGDGMVADLGITTGHNLLADINTGSFTRINSGNRIYLDFFIDWFVPGANSPGTIAVTVEDTSGAGTFTKLTAYISGQGRVTMMSEELSGNLAVSDIDVKVEVISGGSTGSLIYFDYIRVGECARSTL